MATISANAAEVIPATPGAYFNDYAGVVSKEAASRFNEQLAQFERDTSDQVVVAVGPWVNAFWKMLDLPRTVELCRKYNAWLMIDEAHSVGVLGKTGTGIEAGRVVGDRSGAGPDQ